MSEGTQFIADKSPEEWAVVRSIPEYEVSNYGRVRSNQRRKAKLLSPEVSKTGYRRFHLYDRGIDFPMFAHRLVAMAFLPSAPEGKGMVLHNDGDPSNNHVSNLRWGNARDNFDDAMKHGTAHWPRHSSGMNTFERRSDASKRRHIAKLEDRKLTAIDWLPFSKV